MKQSYTIMKGVKIGGWTAYIGNAVWFDGKWLSVERRWSNNLPPAREWPEGKEVIDSFFIDICSIADTYPGYLWQTWSTICLPLFLQLLLQVVRWSYRNISEEKIKKKRKKLQDSFISQKLFWSYRRACYDWGKCRDSSRSSCESWCTCKYFSWRCTSENN